MYATFMVGVYIFPLLGGFLADRYLGYGRTISLGIVVMFIGYIMLTLPTAMNTGFPLIVAALAVIALGTGLFKGNLQALVGNLYDDPKYSALRDRAFNVFYMGINIGAMFAPSASMAVSNWILGKAHLFYDARIPALANEFLKGKLADVSSFLAIAQGQDPSVTLDTLRRFSETYINALSKSYHFGFGVACLSLILSMVIFWAFRKHYQAASLTERQKAKSEASQVPGRRAQPRADARAPGRPRPRLPRRHLLLDVVQPERRDHDLFARDYTVPSVGKATNLWFDLTGLLPVFLAVVGLVFLVRKASGRLARILGGVAFVGFGCPGLPPLPGATPRRIRSSPRCSSTLTPFFIVVLTPLVVGIFGWLNRKGKEPSAPRKIGIGMLHDRRRLCHPGRGLARPGEPQGPRRPGRPGRVPGLRLLAHLDLFHADDRRALPQPDRHLVRFARRPAQVQGPDAGRLVRGDGHRQQPRRRRRLVLDAGAALGGLDHPGRGLPPLRRVHFLDHEAAGKGRPGLAGSEDRFFLLEIIAVVLVGDVGRDAVVDARQVAAALDQRMELLELPVDGVFAGDQGHLVDAAEQEHFIRP